MDNNQSNQQTSEKEPPEAVKSSKNPARAAALFVLTIFALVITWYVQSDRYAPSSSRGYVAANIVQIAPRVSGLVTRIDVDDNSQVEAGQTLYEIDTQPFEFAVQIAEEALKAAMQNVDSTSAQLIAAQAEIARSRVALENQQAETYRIQALSERNLVSTSMRDDANAELLQAEARLESATANSDSLSKQLGVTGDQNVQIRAAQIRLAQAKYDLLSTKVEAPISGAITNLQLDPGQYARAGQSSMVMVDADRKWIVSEMRENQLQLITAGDRVDILFDAVPGEIFKGYVSSISWGINPNLNHAWGLPVSRPSTQWFEPARRIPVRIELDTQQNPWPEQVKAGGKINVVVHSEDEQGVISRLAKLQQQVQSQFSSLY